jgi:hypothetical protein
LRTSYYPLLALNMLQSHRNKKMIIKKLRKKCGWDNPHLQKILGLILANIFDIGTSERDQGRRYGLVSNWKVADKLLMSAVFAQEECLVFNIPRRDCIRMMQTFCPASGTCCTKSKRAINNLSISNFPRTKRYLLP